MKRKGVDNGGNESLDFKNDKYFKEKKRWKWLLLDDIIWIWEYIDIFYFK